MKKKIVKPKLSLDKKVITVLDIKQSQAIAGGVNSLEAKTRCCCDMAMQIE
jgi:hypothetical protein